MRFRCHLFFFQAEDGIRDLTVTGVQTCALPLALGCRRGASPRYFARRGALPRYSPGAFSFPCESLTGRRRKRVRRRVRTGLSAKTAPAVRASAQVAEAQRPCRALPSHASRRVLPGARRLRSAPAAQSPAPPLGTHLQLRAPSPVARLPHPTRIRHPLETPSEKGKVSLIYWTSTHNFPFRSLHGIFAVLGGLHVR